MRQLTLLVSLPLRLEQALEIARTAAPSLRALLARGTDLVPEPSPSALVCQTLGVARQQDWPVAALTARADGLSSGAGYWLRLDPAHLEVGMGGLMLRPAAELGLTPHEAATLAGSLASLGLEIQAPTAERWYLRSNEVPALATTPLDQVAGAYLSDHLPRGRDASRLMARVNEAQMVLHDHPVNQAREARGLAPVNGLWLWGGGTLPDVSKPESILAANDADLAALARGAGARTLTVPPRLADLVQDGQGRGCALLAPAETAGDPHEVFAQLEADWFKPLLRGLQRGEPSRLELHLLTRPGRAVALGSLDAWRVWR